MYDIHKIPPARGTAILQLWKSECVNVRWWSLHCCLSLPSNTYPSWRIVLNPKLICVPVPAMCTTTTSTKRKILRVSWTAKKINEWVRNKAGVKRELLDIVKARKLWSHRQETRELPEERYNARNNARCTQATKTTHGLDGQHPRRGQDSPWKWRVSQNDRMTEDRDKWRKYVHSVANSLGSRTAKEQNRTERDLQFL